VQRDYVLRLIEQAGTILKLLLRRILERSASRDELGRDLQRAAHLGGLDLDLLRLCDADGLLHLVAPGGEPDPSRTWLAAETLYLDGLAAELDDRPAEAAQSFAKARALFGMLQPDWVLPTGFPEATARIADIDDHLGPRPDRGSP
jgi:hypothetical protein